MRMSPRIARHRCVRRRVGFTIAELLVVVGIISLLLAVMLPPVQLARRQALTTQCRVNLQQIGRALEALRLQHNFYPLWDDGGSPLRYTWIDVLVQQRLLGTYGSSRDMAPDTRTLVQGTAQAQRPTVRIGYCPEDQQPDGLNAARNGSLIYPLGKASSGVDYSYGIGVPLSAGGWAWRPGGRGDDARSRRFPEYVQNASNRVLAADAYDTRIFNLSGFAMVSNTWNDPTQYDNTVAWQRHSSAQNIGQVNALFQDGHIATLRYMAREAEPINTALSFVWYPGEPLDVDPDSRFGNNWYPCVPAPNFGSDPPGNVIPDELVPCWYTRTKRWTMIPHK